MSFYFYITVTSAHDIFQKAYSCLYIIGLKIQKLFRSVSERLLFHLMHMYFSSSVHDVCVFIVRCAVHVGLLLWVCSECEVDSWLWLYSGSLHGPGQNLSGAGSFKFSFSFKNDDVTHRQSSWVCVCVFQVIVFLHTVLLSKELPLKRALVVCPLNTVLNWRSEFDQWQRGLRPNVLWVSTIPSLSSFCDILWADVRFTLPFSSGKIWKKGLVSHDNQECLFNNKKH